ncbi:MAG: uroporphyrin-III methyltransferase [Caulobacteraceae bacterium]|nr:uroporphyrin-III methyltransferase [Caulobacteraceae bacterium]
MSSDSHRNSLAGGPPGGRLVALRGGEAQRAGGKVWLVGAGPGDPELLTLKALRVLRGAQVVVHDGLVSPEILSLAPAGARRIDVAKRKSRHTLPQAEINRLLVALAREGLEVVRLKAGDPFIFGRGGEEMAHCQALGVEVEAVPGLTAALASGLPLTHRDLAQSLTLITGHAAHGEPDLDWPALARPNQTVAIYMGLSNAGLLAQRLIEAGRDPATPAAVIENASRPDERRLVTTLADLIDGVVEWTGPALLVIGEVAALTPSIASAIPALPGKAQA